MSGKEKIAIIQDIKICAYLGGHILIHKQKPNIYCSVL